MISLGILVLAEAYMFGFNNSDHIVFSGKYSGILLTAGISLILVLAIVLFALQLRHFKRQNRVAERRNDTITSEALPAETISETLPESEPEATDFPASGDAEFPEEEVLTPEAIEEMQSENLLSSGELEALAGEIGQELQKAEQQLELFSLEIYTQGNREMYCGLQAAIIHLNRIPILYNDLKQFRGNYTGYDRRLIEALQAFSNALSQYQTLATQQTGLQREMGQRIQKLYNAQFRELTAAYRGMINRLYQKQAIDLFEPVVRILKNIREVMTPLEADNPSV